MQYFPIPIGVDWFSGFYAFIMSVGDFGVSLKATYNYMDGNMSQQNLSTVSAGNYQRITLTPTAGKYLKELRIDHLNTVSFDSYLDGLFMVF